MTHLLVSAGADQDSPAGLLEWPVLSDTEHGPDVRFRSDPNDADVETALQWVVEGRVRSLALTHRLPDANRAWIAYEFWSKAVLESGVNNQVLEAAGWTAESAHKELVIWHPPQIEISERAAFAATILDPTPQMIEVEAEQDLADETLFGQLATTKRGGSSALMALSGAAPNVPNVLLRNPAALELEMADKEDSLPDLVDKRILTVHAVSGETTTTATRLELDGFPDPDDARSQWDAADRSHGYWLLLQFKALVDPPVGIPPGHIFEQRSVNGVQTLAVASTLSFVVNPGPALTAVVPAWCLNQNLSPPSGQQVSLTPMRARYPAAMGQSDVWEDRRRVLSS